MALPNVFKPPPVNGVPQWGRAVNASSYLSNVARNPGFKSGAVPMGGPGGPGGPGGNPYAGILNEYLNSAKANFAAQGAADAASRDAALRRFVISYGQVPDFAALGISPQMQGFLKGAINQTVRDLAAKNEAEGTSIHARTLAANAKANRLIPAQLAARGMLRSGQTGADLAEQAQQFKITNFDQLNELLGGMEGTVGNFLMAERARQDALAQAELQAQMLAAQQWGGDMYGSQQGPTSVNPAYPRQQIYSFAGSQASASKKPPRTAAANPFGTGVRRYGF